MQCHSLHMQEWGINGANSGQKKIKKRKKVGMTKENAKMNEQKKKSNHLMKLDLKIQINLSRTNHYQSSRWIPGQCQQQQQQDPDVQVDSQHQQIHCSPRGHRQNAVF